MGLSRKLLQKAALTAFKAAGDVVTEHVVKLCVQTPGAYDPDTGERAFTVVEHTLPRALVTGLSEQEMDWFSGDLHMQKIVIAGPDFPSGVVMDTHDYVLIDEVRWEIARAKAPPAGALYTLFVRGT